MSERATTTPSRDFFSRPRSWARAASFQTAGSSRARATSFSFDCLPSKSKIPPQILLACVQVRKAVGEAVQAFGFHGDARLPKRKLYRLHGA
jgi:hypothetical protein